MRNDEVTFSDIGDAMAREIGRWGEDKIAKANVILEDEAGKIVDEIARTTAFRDSPKKGSLRKSFVATPVAERKGILTYRIWARKNGKYRIVHLVENGHRKRGGGYVAPRHFLLPLSEKHSDSTRKRIAELFGGKE